MENVISEDVAIKDVDKFLNHRRFNDRKKEKNKEVIEALVDAVCDGILIVNQDEENGECTITQKLVFPPEVDGAPTVTALTYKPRIHNHEISSATKGIKVGDDSARGNAIIGVMTNTPRGVIAELELTDLGLASNIVGLYSV